MPPFSGKGFFSQTAGHLRCRKAAAGLYGRVWHHFLHALPAQDHEGVQMFDARALHGWLDNRHGFTKWFDLRVADYGFEEGTDFWAVVPNKPTKGRPRRDYLITIDMAKELAMVERTEKGRATRRYFIEMEKAATLISQGQPDAGPPLEGEGPKITY